MSDEACQISTRPLPPLDEFEVRDLILRAHDVLRTLAALGGYPAPVVPTANPCAADSDGGTARHTKGEGAVSAGTAAERDKQSKPKYRKRRVSFGRLRGRYTRSGLAPGNRRRCRTIDSCAPTIPERGKCRWNR
ncbi:MAG: hypothetical protein BJ554DRAFT_8467 [Olpidium bornovanus]|uniref:Uncharacterized protein n=1 Tax=Olpidium bornovanus TaxID=278681 RepID=A0A8H8DJ04_9FUNG|nr:MAG: hypothetical protein BJ554DRAFT_8467 [Olpidium bornovanus]